MQAPLELVGLGSSSSMDSFASWKMNGSGMEKEERERRRHFKEKMSLEDAHHHRRPWIRARRKKEMTPEGEKSTKFCDLREL
ncbi:hypothetical protein HKD37_20G055643 [Glycine soja]